MLFRRVEIPEGHFGEAEVVVDGIVIGILLVQRAEQFAGGAVVSFGI